MIRKIIPVLLFLTGIIPLGCCSEGPSGLYNLQMRGLNLINSTYLHRSIGISKDFLLPTVEAYTQDTLLVSPSFDYKMLAQQSFSLQHAAFALSCDEYPFYTELQDKITAMEVYSNQPFNEVEAGEPLNSKIVVVDKQY